MINLTTKLVVGKDCKVYSPKNKSISTIKTNTIIDIKKLLAKYFIQTPVPFNVRIQSLNIQR